jgi:tRNA1Val (adenine37-N6)-methyltransferase
MLTTEGHLLGGRVVYRQPATGYRSGLEPVLLAAAVPAQPGERILEAGTGAGAALLCLGFRVPGIHSVGVEVDAKVAELAQTNCRSNGFHDIEVVAGRIEEVALAHVGQVPFDHAIANPPYHLAAGTASPVSERQAARRGSETSLLAWIGRLAGLLRDRGSLTLVVPAGAVPICVTAMAAARCPCTVLFPLWPKAGMPAKLVLLRGVKGGRTPMRLPPGLILHQPDGSFTAAAQAILREGAALTLDA